MKKHIFILAIISCFMYNASGQIAPEPRVRWYTIKDALELQKKHPKKIMIDIYTDWCGWCKKMDAETFSNPVIADFLNKHYYAVKFNAESHDSIVFANHTFVNDGKGARPTHQFALALFQAQNLQPSYPSIAYLDESLQLIRVWSGFWTAPQIEIWLNYVVEEKYKPYPLEEYQKTFVSKIKQSEKPLTLGVPH